jgi:hypothetical protein
MSLETQYGPQPPAGSRPHSIETTTSVARPAVTSSAPALDAALRYAAAEWPVFPCKPDSKEPDTPHGFKDATTDERRIRAWRAAAPGRNPAIATGVPGPDVLDVDVKPDGDGWAAFNRLRQAGLLSGARALVRTRSGGLHVYLAGTDRRHLRIQGRERRTRQVHQPHVPDRARHVRALLGTVHRLVQVVRRPGRGTRHADGFLAVADQPRVRQEVHLSRQLLAGNGTRP